MLLRCFPRPFLLHLRTNICSTRLLIVMSKAKDTGYLFAKMSSEENGIGHIIVGEQKEVKPPIPPTRTFHFDENGNASEKQSVRKWILDNVMLLVTLTGVLVGVVTGEIGLIAAMWT